MKISIKLLFVLFFMAGILQMYSQLKKTKAKIVMTNGEEKFGFAKRHKKEVYLYKERRKSKDKEILPISSIKSIAYVFKEGYREFDYLKDDKRGKYRLLIPLIKGKINLYKSFSTENMSEINNKVDASYKVSKDGVTYHTFKNFKKEARKIFGDCNLIIDLINEGVFSRVDLAEMVIVYNNDCSEIPKEKVKLKELNDKKPIVIKYNKKEIKEKIKKEKVPAKLIKNKTIKVVNEKVLVDLDPIYFNLDKFELTESSLLELDKVVKLMSDYPKLKIEVGSHTDSRGSIKYNLNLSSKRANEVVNYIASHGININRIKAIGFGESQPINNCTDNVKCSELEYEINRRTEFVILNPEDLQ